jgi:beta-fructofuranosidase
MNTKILNLLGISLLIAAPLAGCSSDDNAPEQKDWSTSTYFASTDAAQQTIYYKPQVGFVGDPMPFYDAKTGDFKILYLQDYRPNKSATYHPIWAVSTTDCASYTSLGELINYGGAAEQDAAIGTGSTIYNDADGLYYTFYTGHKYNPSATDCGEAVMMATSADFKTCTKNPAFMMRGSDYGYSKDDFRDPFLFKGDDGKYHMLVATYKNGKGTIADFTSADLKSWSDAGVFMNCMWDRFYECPDVFKMGDWWYLIYSDKTNFMRKVQYFKGRTLDELKACTLNDAGTWPDDHEGFLDTRAFYAGKTASNGTDRYIWGWCPTRQGQDNTNVGASPAEPEWAGNLVCHKIIQHADGSLTLGEVPAIKEHLKNAAEVKTVAQSNEGVEVKNDAYSLSGNSYVLFNRLGNMNRISFTVTASDNFDKFGISFVRGTDSEKYYTIVVNPEGDNRRKVNFEEEGEKGIGFIAGADGYLFNRPADNVYNITIVTDNSVVTMYINDVCCYTNRIYGIQKNCWSINNYGGNITVSNLKVQQQ